MSVRFFMLIPGLFISVFSLAQPVVRERVASPKQPVLGVRSAKLLRQDGLMFKDLNRNGTVDRYEDWRLSSADRSRDLLAKMSLEEKVGFMLISTTRLKNDQSFGGPASKEPITSDFNEQDLVSERNIYTRQPLPTPIMTAAGTTKGVTGFHLRHFILRANVSASITAIHQI